VLANPPGYYHEISFGAGRKMYANGASIGRLSLTDGTNTFSVTPVLSGGLPYYLDNISGRLIGVGDFAGEGELIAGPQKTK